MIYRSQSTQIEKKTAIQGLKDFRWQWLSKQDQIEMLKKDYQMYQNPPLLPELRQNLYLGLKID
jgi:DNA-binding transcriptional regulator YbjK